MAAAEAEHIDDTGQADGAGAWRNKFSVPAFVQGMGVVAALYILLFGWGALTAGDTADSIHKRAPSLTVAIKTETARLPVPVAEAVPGHGEGAAAESDSAGSLLPAPIEGLHTPGPDGGTLPIIRTRDKMTPFAAYRRPFDRQIVSKPIIALAVVDLGLSAAATESAIRALPPEVSLALSPYAATLDAWMAQSRAGGHEVWMMLPLEGVDYPAVDPGPHTLLVGVPSTENETKIGWLMSRVSGYVGFIASSPNSVFTSAPDTLRPVMSNIYGRGLAFADIGAATGSPPETIALGAGAPYANIDVVIDAVPGQADIDAQLARLENLARTQQSASAILHPLPVSYQRVLEWIKTLPDKGFVLAPLSAVAGY